MSTVQASLFDIKRAEQLGEGEDFYVTASSPPRIERKYRQLLDCRLKLLLKERQVFKPGEMKLCDTTIIIQPNHGWNLCTRANPGLGIHFKEEFLNEGGEEYRVRVWIANIENGVKILAQDLCVGHLVMM